MTYIDGFLAAVPTANKDIYRKHAAETGAIFKEFGALSLTDCWGDDLPEGKLNSMHTAVHREDGETVVFAWIMWPSKAVRDDAWEKIMADPRMAPDKHDMPFDGKRMIFGGFDVIFEM